MRVPDEIKKCVVFLGYQLANGEFKFAGTALFLGSEVNGHQSSYLVTARHVIDNIYKLGLDTIWARLNKKGGGAEWRRTNAWRLRTWFPGNTQRITGGEPTRGGHGKPVRQNCAHVL